MKRMFSFIVVVIFIFGFVDYSFSENYTPTYNSGFLVYDKGLQPVQGFAPDPTKAQVAASVNASATTSITVTGWTAIMFASDQDMQVYYGADSTKYMLCAKDTKHTLVIRSDVTTIVIKNIGASSSTVSVWGM